MQNKNDKTVVTVALGILAIFVVAVIAVIIYISSNSNSSISNAEKEVIKPFWVAIGDSITFGEDENRKSYADYLSEECPDISFEKVSWGGLKIQDLVGLVNKGQIDHVNNPSLVTVLIGANDFGFDTPIDEFATGIDEYMQILKGRFPNARIVFLTPLYRDYFGNTIPTMGGTINNLGISLYDYSNVIEQLGLKNNIEVINLTNDNFLNADNIRMYTSDGLHPNTEGNKMIANKLKPLLGL